jgi:RND family efflux transporter MFP subunit
MSEGKAKLEDLRIHRPAEPRRSSRGGLLLLTLAVIVGVAGAVWWLSRPKLLTVDTALVRAAEGPAPNRTVLNASGYVNARRAATVSSKVTGKVVEVHIEEGLRVEAGQVLARLDDTNVRASLLLSQARQAAAVNALEETRVRIRDAQRDLRRQADLLRQAIARQADYDAAETQLQAIEARLAQQQSEVLVWDREVAAWQQQLDDTIIRAPFGGIVTSKNAQPGEMISPISAGGGFTRTGICTIVDMESLEIEIDVNESFINRVEPGQAVQATLDAYPEWKIACKVIAIIPTADRQKSTVKVRVGFDALDRRILPEMGVKVAFHEVAGKGQEHAHARALTLPKGAVQKLDGRDVVFLVRENRVERRAVTLGGELGDAWSVTAGLSEGDRVILNGPASLTDGAVVRFR